MCIHSGLYIRCFSVVRQESKSLSEDGRAGKFTIPFILYNRFFFF